MLHLPSILKFLNKKYILKHLFKESSGILATLNDINLSNISSTNKLSNNVYFRGIHTGRLFLFSLKLT